MKLAIIGEGAISQKHIEAIKTIDGITIAALMGGVKETTKATAEKYSIPFYTLDYDEILAKPEIDAVLIASPTPMHSAQAIKALERGKHALIEIPMADNLKDSELLVRTQEKPGSQQWYVTPRRFNPSHQYIHQKIINGEYTLQQLMVQTYFFRRTNVNALGQPRSWTDHLLWHHAAHSIDLFTYQTGESIKNFYAIQGAKHPTLGIAMDMGIILTSSSGIVGNLSLSFNNNGPLGSFFSLYWR